MKADLTIKQEKFCKKYIETGNATESYRQSYNAENMKENTINKRAHELLSDGKIKGRLQELEQKLQEKLEFTIADALKEYEEARVLAMATDNSSAMVAATTGKSRLFGLDQTKITGTNKVIIKDMSGSGNS